MIDEESIPLTSQPKTERSQDKHGDAALREVVSRDWLRWLLSPLSEEEKSDAEKRADASQ